jgi:hypothetical protein
MSKSRNLSQLASNVDAEGVVLQAGGGTGIESVGAAGNVLTSNGTAWVSGLPTTTVITNGTTTVDIPVLDGDVVVTVAGTDTWTFGAGNLLTLPGGAIIDSSDDNFEVRAVENVNFEAASEINLSTDDGGNIWTFGQDGNITLPSDTSSINYANGSPYGGGGTNTANVTFNDVTVQGVNQLNLSAGPDYTANLAYLQVRAGDFPSHIHFDTGDSEVYDLYIGNDSKFVQVSSTGNIIMSSFDSANSASYAMTLDTVGSLTVPGIITRPVGDTLTLVATGSAGNSASVQVDGEIGRLLLRSFDGTTLNTWELDSAGNTTLPLNGNLNLYGGNIFQIADSDLVITTLNSDGAVNSTLEQSPGDTLTRLEQWSSQDSASWTTADWATGEYTTQGGGTIGAVVFTGATTIIDFVNSLNGTGQIYFSVNGGPLLTWDGSTSGATNITFYTPTLPATDPTTVTSFEYFYSYKSGFEIDYDAEEINIYTNNADIILETNQGRIELSSSNDLTLTGNGSVSLRNNSGADGISIVTDANSGSPQQWQFGVDGNLTLPDNSFAVNYANGTPVTFASAPSVGTVTSGATITPTGSSTQYNVTALAESATFAVPDGTPVDGQKLTIRILDNGTPQTLAWNAIYEVIGTTLPTTTVASKYTYVGCIYDAQSSKWDVVSVAQQA